MGLFSREFEEIFLEVKFGSLRGAYGEGSTVIHQRPKWRNDENKLVCYLEVIFKK